jgi:hypothetical protein
MSFFNDKNFHFQMSLTKPNLKLDQMDFQFEFLHIHVC